MTTDLIPAAMRIDRRPRDPQWTDLGGPDEPGEEYLIVVDDTAIGGTYWCGADYIADGQRWASWGPAGLSMRHPTREDAEQAQVRAYAADPGVVDRQIAAERRENAAAAARQDAADAEQAKARLVERVGADSPGPTVWALPSHHYLTGDQDDVAAVTAWLHAHGLYRVSGRHEVRVEQRTSRRVIVVEELHGWSDDATQTRVVTCTVDPPVVDAPPRPDLVELLDTHYPTTFPLIDFGQNVACVACTRHTSPQAVTVWPCPVFVAAAGRGASFPQVAGT
ncbi:hypothetical protein [Micromonospora profundi]|uniref:hypothetical protein n=1 Tax=Micromonospora profundi TaxID=1420889 RepID=UPI003663D1D5